MIIGTSGDDTINSGDGNDNISAGEGNDTINGGDGNDTVIIVIEDVNDLLRNDIIQYFDDKNKVGTEIIDMGDFNVTAGLSNFEKVAVTARWTF